MELQQTIDVLSLFTHIARGFNFPHLEVRAAGPKLSATLIFSVPHRASQHQSCPLGWVLGCLDT